MTFNVSPLTSTKFFHYSTITIYIIHIYIRTDSRHTHYSNTLHTIQVGNLLPWNAFVTAQPYYQARFCNTQFSDSFENFFAAFFTASQPVGLYLVCYIQVFTEK